jgi:hypothetical protein
MERLHTESISQKVKDFGAGLDRIRGFGSFREQANLDCELKPPSPSAARAVRRQIEASKPGAWGGLSSHFSLYFEG